MYTCNNCGAEFSKPFEDGFTASMGDNPDAGRDYKLCPECGSNDIEEEKELHPAFSFLSSLF